MVWYCVLTSGLATTRGEILDPNDIRSNLNYLTKIRSRGLRVWRRPLRPGSSIIVLSPGHNKTSALPGHLPGGTLQLSSQGRTFCAEIFAAMYCEICI